MSGEMPEKPLDQDHDQEDANSSAEDIVDPRELVMGGGYTKDPREIVTNPAVAPQTLDTIDDLRGDLTRDE